MAIKKFAQLSEASRAAQLASWELAVVDQGGVLAAQVAVRHATLAALLVAGDAGNGEIAVATDAPAIVRYLGTPGVPTVFYRNHVRAMIMTNAETRTGLAMDVESRINLNLATPAISYGLALGTGSGGHSFAPSSIAKADNYMRVSGDLRLSDYAGMTYFEVILEVNTTGTSWAAQRRQALSVPPIGSSAQFNILILVADPVLALPWRIRMYAEGTGTYGLLSSSSIQAEVYDNVGGLAA